MSEAPSIGAPHVRTRTIASTRPLHLHRGDRIDAPIGKTLSHHRIHGKIGADVASGSVHRRRPSSVLD